MYEQLELFDLTPRCPVCDRVLGDWPVYRGPKCAPARWVICIRQSW